MAYRAQRHIEEVKEWLKDHDVETVEVNEEMEKLFKKDLGRVFMKSIVLSHVTNINVLDEMDLMLENKDEEISRILNELNELYVEESGEITLDDLVSKEPEKE